MANAVTAAWRGRSTFARPSLFDDPETGRQSRFWATIIAVVVTLLAVVIATGVIYPLWSAFTIHARHPR